MDKRESRRDLELDSTHDGTRQDRDRSHHQLPDEWRIDHRPRTEQRRPDISRNLIRLTRQIGDSLG